MLWPAGNGSANKVLEELAAKWDLKSAITLLQAWCPVPLDEHGYAKQGEITWVIAECYNQGA